MDNNGPFGRYRDRVDRDAENITGFFSTRAGTITGGVLIVLIAAGALWSFLSGWIG